MFSLKPIEHKIKAAFFGLFKRFLKRKRGKFTPLDGSRLKKVLFLRPEKIGDMVISLPVFDGLKGHFPQIKISVLASPRNDAIITRDPRFDRIYLYRKNLFKDIREMLAIRRERFDCVVDMICDDSVTALFLSQLAAPGKPRVGVGKVKFREYYDFNYDHRLGNTGHIIENTLRLLEAFGIDSTAVSGYAPPFIDDSARQRADRVVSAMSCGDGELRIGYNLSAGAQTRIWAENKSRQLISGLLAHGDTVNVILFAVGDDRIRAARLRDHFRQRVQLVPPGLSLMEATAIIARTHLLISPDTSLVHIARALRVPVVGLYSRFMKNFLLWRPYDQEVGAVVSGNDDNIFDITVSDVLTAFEQVINRMVAVRP